MLWDEIKNIKSSRKELKDFGLVMAAASAVFAAIAYARGKGTVFILIDASLFFLAAAYLNPFTLKPLQKIWMAFAAVMGWVMSRVLLTVLFYFVITPIALLSKAFGKQFLVLTRDPHAESYWTPTDEKPKDKESIERQF